LSDGKRVFNKIDECPNFLLSVQNVVQIPLSLPECNRQDILLFFKLFDPERETLE
jgi:hypothetical protein